jgi:small ubiquitin-related modifier
LTQTGEETFFKIKKTTKMSKVFETYAQRKGVQAASLRFLLDGERILDDQTPKMLELDDQDQIDCMLEQTGGSDSVGSFSCSSKNNKLNYKL